MRYLRLLLLQELAQQLLLLVVHHKEGTSCNAKWCLMHDSMGLQINVTNSGVNQHSKMQVVVTA